MKRISKFYFVTAGVGFLVCLPPIIFGKFGELIVETIFGFLAPLTNEIQEFSGLPPTISAFTALILAINFFFGVGLVMKIEYGRRLIGWLTGLMKRIPGYETVHSLIEFFLKKKGTASSTDVALQAVWIPSPDCEEGTYALVMAEAFGFSVLLVPSAPAPSNGFIRFCRSKRLVRIPITSAEAMQCVVACGAGFERILQPLAGQADVIPL